MSEPKNVRTHKWTPGKVNSVDQKKDADGKLVYEDDGITPVFDVTEVDSPFTGSVTYKIPKYTERLKFMKDCKIGVKDESPDTEKMVNLAIQHITIVDLTHKETETKITCVDDLEYIKEGADVLNSIANELIQGVSLGKNSKIDSHS